MQHIDHNIQRLELQGKYTGFTLFFFQGRKRIPSRKKKQQTTTSEHNVVLTGPN